MTLIVNLSLPSLQSIGPLGTAQEEGWTEARGEEIAQQSAFILSY